MNTGTTVDALITGELNNKAGKKKAGVMFLSPPLLAPISSLVVSQSPGNQTDSCAAPHCQRDGH
jgi:hypothetical protein